LLLSDVITILDLAPTPADTHLGHIVLVVPMKAYTPPQLELNKTNTQLEQCIQHTTIHTSWAIGLLW